MTYTFNARRRIRPFPGLIYTEGAVIVPNYEDARIDFGFPAEKRPVGTVTYLRKT